MTTYLYNVSEKFTEYLLGENSWYPTNIYLGLSTSSMITNSGSYYSTNECTDINYQRVLLDKSKFLFHQFYNAYPGDLFINPCFYQVKYSGVITFPYTFDSNSSAFSWFLTDTISSTGILLGYGAIYPASTIYSGSEITLSGVRIRYPAVSYPRMLDQFLNTQYMFTPNYLDLTALEQATKHILGVSIFPTNASVQLISTSKTGMGDRIPVTFTRTPSYSDNFSSHLSGNTIYIDSSGNPVLYQALSTGSVRAAFLYYGDNYFAAVGGISYEGREIRSSGGAGGCNLTWYTSYGQFPLSLVGNYKVYSTGPLIGVYL